MHFIYRPVFRLVIFGLFLAYFDIRLLSYHYHLIIYPFPQGLREGAMMVSTRALVHGINPYDMALQPQLMNQYGILYPLAVWPWAKVFGTTMLVHRAVTAFFILASCVLIFFVMRVLRIPVLLNLWAVSMLYASLLYPGTSTPTIDPGAMGLFLFLLTVCVPWFCRYSRISLAASVLLGLCAFYTKAYFTLGACIMTAYLFLFVSKSKGFLYGTSFLSAWALSAFAVNSLLPAYFDNCFFAALNMSHAWSKAERLHEQVVMYAKLHEWVLVLLAAFLAGWMLKLWLASPRTKLPASQLNPANWINISNLHRPLIAFALPLPFFAAFCASLVLYVSLGRHTGAMMWYFFQLLSPFFLICAVWIFSRQPYWSFVCVPFLVFNLLTMTSKHNDHIFKKHLEGWNEVVAALKSHQHILNTPLIAPILVEQDKDVIDDGQAEYFGTGGERPTWIKAVVPGDPRVDAQLLGYFANIRQQVQTKQFDIIVLQPGLLPLGVGDDIKENYKYEGGMELFAPQDERSYGITVWKPR